MSTRANPKLVGAFVVGAVALAAGVALLLSRGALFAHTVPVVMFFDGDVHGLAVGAPIAFRGVRVGLITRIQIQVGSGGKIAVYGRFDEKQLPGPEPERALEGFVREGLRAQLAEQSLVTGQMYVGLNLLPSTPATRYGFDRSAFEIPTVPSPLQQVTQRALGLLAKLESLKLGRLINTLTATAEGVNQRVRSAQVTETLRSVSRFFGDADSLAQQAGPVLASVGKTADSLGATSDTARQAVADAARDLRRLAQSLERASGSAQALLAEGQKLVGDVDAQVDPLAASVTGTLTRAQGTLAGVDGVLRERSSLGYRLGQAIQQLTETARSVRELADYLDRHPEALLAGKGGAGAK
jgi:paraquat-inducible protein B